jgi:hypothetical protein
VPIYISDRPYRSLALAGVVSSMHKSNVALFYEHEVGQRESLQIVTASPADEEAPRYNPQTGSLLPEWNKFRLLDKIRKPYL